jgi:diguanylate cyclase (GGDEF)-like protein
VFDTTGADQSARPPEGCQLVELFINDRTRVCRVRSPDGSVVVRKEALGPNAAARARHESTILQRLVGVRGIPQPTADSDREACVVITHDVGGRALADLLSADGCPDPAELPHVALRLATILAAVHGAGVIHRDVNPTNIVSSAVDGELVLIDFDLATTFAETRPAFTHHREIVGRLPYLAPEQTGRTALSVDHRADLYGLGASLYELATGRPPFGDGDPLQLIRDILTAVAAPLVEVVPAIGRSLSDIVARLLEKEPGRRYQSAEGLANDLRQLCSAPDQPLTLGERDFPIRLVAPSTLVGRDHEIGVLRDALDHAADIGSHGVLVAGSAGVGKSALIAQLRSMVTARRGWFVGGKFEQYRHDAATDAVVQALGGIGRLLLAESESDLSAWRIRIRARLGANAALVTAALPEFAALFGAEHQARAADPAQDDVRLRHAALDLLRAVASPERPIVLVLDDLQWASQSAMGFIDALQSDVELRGLLFVGAYRDHEVDAAHPLSAMISRWQRLDVAPTLLALQNLAPAGQGSLLAEMLRLPAAEARALAEVIAERSGGNPYDTVELVNALRRDGALTLDETGWRWDPPTLRRHVGSGDVIDLLTQRIDRLPPDTRYALRMLACVGSDVPLDLFATAIGRLPAEALHQLVPALEDGLLVMEQVNGGDASPVVRFRHDRVHQAAHADSDGNRLGVPDDDRVARSRARLEIARRLAGARRFGAEAAEQYLAALPLVGDVEERRSVAELFESSAAAAAALSNHETAERYLSAAISLLSDDADPGNAMLDRLQVAWHSSLYSIGRLDQADAVYRVIEGRCADPLALVGPACVQMSSLTNRVRAQEAIALGFTVLSVLGFAVPGADARARTSQGVDAMYDWINTVTVDDDLNRPAMTDPVAVAASQVINKMTSPAFFCDEVALHWLVTEGQRLWARHGPSAPLAPTIAHACHTTVEFRDDYATGVRIIRHVLAVSEAGGDELNTAHARFLYAVTGAHWFGPVEEDIAQARLAREGLVRGGNLQHACFSFLPSLSGLLDSGPSLDALHADAVTALAFAARTGNQTAAGRFVIYRQFARTMRRPNGRPGDFDDELFNATTHLADHGANRMSVAFLHIHWGLAAALFGDTQRLIQESAAAMSQLSAIGGVYPTVLAYLLRAMALAQLARSTDRDARTNALEGLDECHGWLTRRAVDAPENFRHLAQLVEAERAWATDDFQGACRAFDSALSNVQVHRRPWHAALVAERAALFHLEYGLEHRGHSLLVDARAHYHRWGATRKVVELERTFPFLGSLDRSAAAVASGEAAAPHSANMFSDAIDMLAILRASQSLSSETSLDRLHASVVEQVRALTGATAVRFLLHDDDAGGWIIPTTGRDGEPTVALEVAAADGLLSRTAFHYVERTGQPLLVADATRDDRFARDPYLSGMDRCSLMVVPVAAQGVVRAMLMLENRLNSGAFSADRLDAVMLIGGQLAVSVSNAMLYRSLENRVADRTRALQAANERLKELTLMDPLTELANRRRFADVLGAAWHSARERHTSMAVVMIDIDHFKLYNDRYGHPAGDACLRKVSAIVASTVRQGTDLVCRYGGEEFAIILPEADRQRAHDVAERVRKAIAGLGEPHLGSPTGHLTLSVGVAAVVPSEHGAADALVQAADTALYQAKQNGRNTVWAA